ncbi:MAG TPA: division/cell wall cluster transcriptional repressor MraZ [Bauldia sp.]|nr:division/cell wall cluster transcriptional repressor MraZ [Bauldia sp.]
MNGFVSTYTNRLDAKGRVSIPAPFRAVLAVDGFDGLFCTPTLDMKAFDAGGNALREHIEGMLAGFPPFSEEHEYLSTTLIGGSEILHVDPDGRVILTDTILRRTGITERVTFVGHRFKFQIWEPDRFAAYWEEANSRSRDLRKGLGSGHRAAGTAAARPE